MLAQSNDSGASPGGIGLNTRIADDGLEQGRVQSYRGHAVCYDDAGGVAEHMVCQRPRISSPAFV